ncbi:hypothetical protein [Chitinophaga sp. Cy-1792]|uniref:hypothetical protein n=1 Tax=Chitinophaga sp. Cy-1792 TaxID=2608339 RepID=UPI001422480A|nr:hypothetical protein [Chitinophaga sp. Cy-1792]NIG52804.1 hypothetical protein [Chitinophaga sp. Cy-1792]
MKHQRKSFDVDRLLSHFRNNENQFAYTYERFKTISKGRIIEFRIDNQDELRIDTGSDANKISIHIDVKTVREDSEGCNKVLNLKNREMVEIYDLMQKLYLVILRQYYGFGKPVIMKCYQNGWNSYEYYIYDFPVNDSIKRISGKPLNDSGFGRQCYLR